MVDISAPNTSIISDGKQAPTDIVNAVGKAWNTLSKSISGKQFNHPAVQTNFSSGADRGSGSSDRRSQSPGIGNSGSHGTGTHNSGSPNDTTRTDTTQTLADSIFASFNQIDTLRYHYANGDSVNIYLADNNIRLDFYNKLGDDTLENGSKIFSENFPFVGIDTNGFAYFTIKGGYDSSNGYRSDKRNAWLDSLANARGTTQDKKSWKDSQLADFLTRLLDLDRLDEIPDSARKERETKRRQEIAKNILVNMLDANRNGEIDADSIEFINYPDRAALEDITVSGTRYGNTSRTDTTEYEQVRANGHRIAGLNHLNILPGELIRVPIKQLEEIWKYNYKGEPVDRSRYPKITTDSLNVSGKEMIDGLAFLGEVEVDYSGNKDSLEYEVRDAGRFEGLVFARNGESDSLLFVKPDSMSGSEWGAYLLWLQEELKHNGGTIEDSIQVYVKDRETGRDTTDTIRIIIDKDAVEKEIPKALQLDAWAKYGSENNPEPLKLEGNNIQFKTTDTKLDKYNLGVRVNSKFLGRLSGSAEYTSIRRGGSLMYNDRELPGATAYSTFNRFELGLKEPIPGLDKYISVSVGVFGQWDAHRRERDTRTYLDDTHDYHPDFSGAIYIDGLEIGNVHLYAGARLDHDSKSNFHQRIVERGNIGVEVDVGNGNNRQRILAEVEYNGDMLPDGSLDDQQEVAARLGYGIGDFLVRANYANEQGNVPGTDTIQRREHLGIDGKISLERVLPHTSITFEAGKDLSKDNLYGGAGLEVRF